MEIIIVILTSVNILILSLLVIVLARGRNPATLATDPELSLRIKDLGDKVVLLEKSLLVEVIKQLNADFVTLNRQLQTRFEEATTREGEHYRQQSELRSAQYKEQNQLFSQTIVKIQETLEKRLSEINQKVDERLEKGFAQTNKTFVDVMTSIAKIEDAKKKMEDLSLQVTDLQTILGNSQARGKYGEMQLTSILDEVFENNHELYSLQYDLGRGLRPDAVIFIQGQILCIDSKFPLANYLAMDSCPAEEVEKHKKQFRSDLFDKVKETAKYVVAGKTFNQAFMFVPSDGLLAYIHQEFPELIVDAYNRRVALLSPATLLPTLAAIKSVNLTLERNKQIETIHKQLVKLGQNFEKFGGEWEKLSRAIQSTLRGTDDFSRRVERINSQFTKISEVNLIEEHDEVLVTIGDQEE